MNDHMSDLKKNLWLLSFMSSSPVVLLLTFLQNNLAYCRQWQNLLSAEAVMFTHPENQGDDTASPVCECFCFYISLTCSRSLDSKGALENRCAQHYFVTLFFGINLFLKILAKDA